MFTLATQNTQVLQGSTGMQVVLMTLVGAGLVGCFAATLGLSDRAGRGQRLVRPRSMAVAREIV